MYLRLNTIWSLDSHGLAPTTDLASRGLAPTTDLASHGLAPTNELASHGLAPTTDPASVSEPTPQPLNRNPVTLSWSLAW